MLNPSPCVRIWGSRIRSGLQDWIHERFLKPQKIGKFYIRKVKVSVSCSKTGRYWSAEKSERSEQSRLAAQRRSDGSSLHLRSSWGVGRLHWTALCCLVELVQYSLMQYFAAHNNLVQHSFVQRSLERWFSHCTEQGCFLCSSVTINNTKLSSLPSFSSTLI